jgi:uncharacterized HhH-GPD family protein
MNLTITDPRELEPFDFRWPDSTERFDRGFQCTATADRDTFEVRHGIGGRHVYGQERVHTVTWINGQPIVEGVAADDFESSRCLVSAIKGPDGKLVRTPGELPAGYEELTIVAFDTEIDAPRTRRALAAKIKVDDVGAWAALALLRIRHREGRLPKPPGTKKAATPRPIPTALESVTNVIDKRVVADSLLSYAASYAHKEGEPLPPLTSDTEADALVREDPFAFLLAVIFDQNIPYVRAWRAPLELQRRLGAVDPATLLADPEAVRAAVGEAPALHRFVEKMPRWLVSAAHRVMENYSGDAGSIWSGSPTAKDLQARFLAFDGIGQKKAAMAVELLERHLGVSVTMMEGSNIAYDIHVRRVFMRAGLADRDDPSEMVAVARELHPDRPGALDDPAWRIGAQWCHRQDPECGACAIRQACPKLVERGTQIIGA